MAAAEAANDNDAWLVEMTADGRLKPVNWQVDQLQLGKWFSFTLVSSARGPCPDTPNHETAKT